MMFKDEAAAILDGNMPASQIPVVLEHLELGGFHGDVLPADRKAIKAWLTSQHPLPDQMAAPVGQLELLGEHADV